jgi:hypothetical protein
MGCPNRQWLARDWEAGGSHFGFGASSSLRLVPGLAPSVGGAALTHRGLTLMRPICNGIGGLEGRTLLFHVHLYVAGSNGLSVWLYNGPSEASIH